MIETRRLKNVVIFVQTILSFVLSKLKISTMILHGNMEMLQLKIFENMKSQSEKRINQNYTSTFSTIADSLVCIRNSLSLNCRMFPIKTLYQFEKDSFVGPSTSVIKSFNTFQKNSVNPKKIYLHSFPLLTSASLQNL